MANAGALLELSADQRSVGGVKNNDYIMHHFTLCQQGKILVGTQNSELLEIEEKNGSVQVLDGSLPVPKRKLNALTNKVEWTPQWYIQLHQVIVKYQLPLA